MKTPVRRIACIGLSTDDTFRYTVERVRKIAHRPPIAVDLARCLGDGNSQFVGSYRMGGDRCHISLGNQDIEQLDSSMSAYNRLILATQQVVAKDEHLNGLRCAERFCEALLDTDFFSFTVNPWSSGWNNGVRPIHYRELAALGMKIPPYAVTNDVDTAKAFISQYGDVIVKSASHHRTIARRVTPTMQAKLGRLVHSPAVFQQAISGPDVRVHVVGSECYSLGIESPTDDYRYTNGKPLRYFKVTPPVAISRLCVEATRQLGLRFSGVDFKICVDSGKWYCLEVNPMPGYSGYDRRLSGVISAALVRILEGAACD